MSSLLGELKQKLKDSVKKQLYYCLGEMGLIFLHSKELLLCMCYFYSVIDYYRYVHWVTYLNAPTPQLVVHQLQTPVHNP